MDALNYFGVKSDPSWRTTIKNKLNGIDNNKGKRTECFLLDKIKKYTPIESIEAKIKTIAILK